MPVVAVPVVDRQDVGGFLAQHRRQALGGLVGVGAQEARRIVVLLPSGHARIGVAEPHDAGHTERRGRRLGLDAPAVDERLAGCEVVGHLAVIAVRRDHQHHPVPLGRGAGDRATGADDLIVGMGVEADQRCHDQPAAGSACFTAPDDSHDSMHVGGDAPLAEHLAGVGTGECRWHRHLRHGTAEPWGRSRLGGSGDVDERAAFDVVRMLRPPRPS